ncbi:MAG: permease [Bacteroidales bacterium]|nr:permease [Bacteroidales bacterium]MCF8391268.1 permease [Bacteroidales bacterium]
MNAVFSFISDFWSELVILTLEMAPYLLLGFLFAGVLYAWFPSHKIVRYLGKNNSASALNAALLGIPLPLCSCGVIPTGISFYKNGASKGSAVSFLISTPQTGVDSIMVTWSLLGLPMAIIRPIIAFVTGVLGGVLTNSLEKKENGHAKPVQKPLVEEKKKVGILGMLNYAFGEFLEDIVKWLVIGLLIAALIAVIIPDDFFLRYLSNDYLSMLIILAASIPLYVCATGSVPIAAVLLMKGLSPGAAIVFLMAGPATNAATISVIGNSLGRKTLYRYLFSIIAGALVFGTIVNEFLPREWFAISMPGMDMGEHNHGILPHWIQVVSGLLLAIAIANGLFRKYISPRINSKKKISTPLIADKMSTKIKVEGMTCNHCKMNVENGIKGVSGVSGINIDLISGNVIIEGENVDLQAVKQAVDGLGYKVVE